MGVSYIDIYKLLPRIDCGKCGRATCLMFATALIEGKAAPEECTKMTEEARKAVREKLVEGEASGQT